MSKNEERVPSTYWSEHWKERESSRRPAADAAAWDERAPHFGTKMRPSDYILRFIELLDLEPEDTVLDMGCGNGGVAIPLAEAGHQVLACDFSKGMLAALEERMEAAGVTGITTKLMSWDDDWVTCGVDPQCVDVAFASRSMITRDLRDSILKLTATARKRACTTLGAGYTPKVSAGILQELGFTKRPECDYQYAFNILVDEGYQPSVTFIRNDRRNHFESYEAAFEHFGKLIDTAGMTIDPEHVAVAHENLAGWLERRLEPNENAGQVNDHDEVEGPLKIEVPNDIIWAFLSWDVKKY